jgi:hypothetical protein
MCTPIPRAYTPLQPRDCCDRQLVQDNSGAAIDGYGDVRIVANEVYSNTSYGIDVSSVTEVSGNLVHHNATGIYAEDP